jgi:Mg/Co/Ni transporter MgtE
VGGWNMTKTNYHRNDLIDLIEEQYKGDYPSMSGSFYGTLASVLIQVEVRAPELFQEIMEFEMGTQERIREFQMFTKGIKENNND